ncbi:hypothetical protein J2S28_005779 [Rhizobium sp. SLBN-94]|nr:hypothetical protein [Rhizobium sp. SLBN-94]
MNATSPEREAIAAGRPVRRFLIAGHVHAESGDDFEERLAEAYRGQERPLCLCREPGVPMYVARVGAQFVIKRMPLSGGDHESSCPSHEPPYDLSGLGPLMGTAIKLDAAAGTAALKLDFALSKRGAAHNAEVNGDQSDSVKSEGKRLSLRALLHLLWQEAGLTQWTVNWTGKRHWWHVHHHLLEASRTMTVRGEMLSERLFVPERFRAEARDMIEQRRSRALAGLIGSGGGAKKLMLLVGEIKEFAAARSGQQVIVKHMPGFRLHLEETAWGRLQRRFEPELALWRSDDRFHLMAIATIEVNPAGIVVINEIAIMTVTEQWLPIENAHEERLLNRLMRMRGKTVKGLRFNLAAGQPIANVVLPEAKPRPVGLYIVPPNADEQFDASLRDMIDMRPDMAAWIWRVAEGEMPAMPWEQELT